MDSEIYNECLDKNETGKSWSLIAEQNGFASGEVLRSSFRREKRRREKGQTSSGQTDSKTNDENEHSSYEEGNGFINVICASKRMLTKEDIIEQFKIDTNIWEVDKLKVGTHEAYRKDRKVQWDVSNGTVTSGHVDDSGKLLIAPLFHIEVKFVKKVAKWDEESIKLCFENIKIKDLSPIAIVPSQYSKDGVSVVLPIADLHLGLFTTKYVEGNEYNMSMAEKYFYDIISQTKERLENRKVKELVFILGNDFLNSDNLQNQTEHGTPQDTQMSWFYLMDKATEMIIKGVNSLLEISKIKIINVPSNHDRHSMYGVMKVVETYFRDNKNVEVDNSPLYTKYLTVGKTLFGLTHDIDPKKALDVITTDAHSLWSDSNHVVWLLGHLHKAMQYEQRGIMEIYRLPTVSGNSRWSTEKHYVQSDRKTQLFTVDEKNGILDVMNIIVG